MNTQIKLVVGAVLLLPVIVVATASANNHQGNGRYGSNPGQVRIAQADDDGNEETEDQKRQKLLERLEVRKQKHQLRLSFAEERRLNMRCKASQGKMRSLEGRIQGIETSRTRVYGNLLSRLNSLAERLEAQGLDVAELNEHVGELGEMIDEFNAQLAEYKQVVADMAAMDCEEDPEAFKASLEEARVLLGDLRNHSREVRAYVLETIKPTLQALKAQLEESSDSEEDEEENGTDGEES
jgi:hypothetical protein